MELLVASAMDRQVTATRTMTFDRAGGVRGGGWGVGVAVCVLSTDCPYDRRQVTRSGAPDNSQVTHSTQPGAHTEPLARQPACPARATGQVVARSTDTYWTRKNAKQALVYAPVTPALSVSRKLPTLMYAAPQL